MRLIQQPGDGTASLVRAINGAKKSVEIMIFRFNRSEIERALADAVKRGVFVHALIAHTNSSAEANLRKLEQRLLAEGITVARSDNDLTRYHGKFMIVDRRELFVMAFNLTGDDVVRSRSFGVATKSAKLVKEAARLFEADVKRLKFESSAGDLVVSPVNARKRLEEFLSGAKRQILIYDPRITDPAMIRILLERAKAGLDIRIFGRVPGKKLRFATRKFPMRFHTRTIIRDGKYAFIGSQSLRALELDSRREVGIILHDRGVVKRLIATFESDWRLAGESSSQQRRPEIRPATMVARKVAKAVTKDLPPVASVLKDIVKDTVGVTANGNLNAAEVEKAVKDVVRDGVVEVVKDAVKDAMKEAQRKAD